MHFVRMLNHGGMWTNERKRGSLALGAYTVCMFTFMLMWWKCSPVWMKKERRTTDTRRFVARYAISKAWECASDCRCSALCIKITIRKSQQVEDLNCNFHVQCSDCCCMRSFRFQLNQSKDLLCFFFPLCHWFVVVASVESNARVNKIWMRVNLMENRSRNFNGMILDDHSAVRTDLFKATD